MGLLPIPEAYAGPPTLPPGNGRRIVIVGAGIAGMVLGWELRRAGYAPLILEARTRAGGRNWSLRSGDEIREAASVQRIAWDAGPHMYLNPGPARLPYHHEGILSYCRELGVPLEVMSNDNRGALLQSDTAFDGRPQRNRQVVNDIRGYVAELAAKAVDRDALAERGHHRGQGAHPRSAAQLRRARSGTWPTRGPAAPAMRSLPAAARRRARAASRSTCGRSSMPNSGGSRRNFGESWHQAATMMQPVGGMGRIGEAFGAKLGSAIIYGAEVRALRRTGNGARVVWRDAKTGREHAIEAPLVVVTIPLPVLRDGRRRLLAGRSAPPSRRWTTCRRSRSPSRPSAASGSWTRRSTAASPGPRATSPRSGTLRPASTSGRASWSAPTSGRTTLGEKFAAMSPAARLEAALADGERLHPDYRRHLTKGVSVAWKNIPFSGCGLGGVEPRRARRTLRHAAGRRRPVSVRRRAHVLHQRLAGGRGALGALRVAGDRRAHARLTSGLRPPRPCPHRLLEVVPDAKHCRVAPGRAHDLHPQRQSRRGEPAADHHRRHRGDVRHRGEQRP